MSNLPIKILRVITRDSAYLDRKYGLRGEIHYDQDNNTLRLYDGNSAEGQPLAKNDLSNVSNTDFATKAASAGISGGGSGNTTVTVGTSTPAEPENGNLWLNTNNGNLYVYINDGTSSQWIQPAYPTFSGNYDDLTNKPTFADVATSGDYADLSNTPTNVSDFTNDAGYLTAIPGTITSSILADDSSLLIDAEVGSINTHALSQVSAVDGQALLWNGSNGRWQPGDVELGSFAFLGSNIDTTDSSAITITPALTAQSDLTVENELIAAKAQITDLTLTGDISSQGSGTPEIVSDNEINLVAGTTIVLNGLTTLFASAEVLNVISEASGTVTHNLETGSVFYHETPGDNFTANFTNVSTTNNRTLSIALIINQGGTAYMPTAIQIDGASVTPDWQGGGGAPAGNANQTDVVSFTLIRVSNNWSAIASLTTYA